MCICNNNVFLYILFLLIMSSMEEKVALLCQEETTDEHLVLQKETFGHKRNKTSEESQLHYPSELKHLTVPINSKENSSEINKTENCIQKKQNKIGIYILTVIFSAVAIILYQFDE